MSYFLVRSLNIKFQHMIPKFPLENIYEDPKISNTVLEETQILHQTKNTKNPRQQ